MVPSPVSPTQRTSHHTTSAPLRILRTETVLSRFPIHHLSTGGAITIRIARTNAQGELDLHWAVSYNAYYGPPRHLAYKLDTIVINQRLDAVPRPLPRVLTLGSLRQIGTLLDLQASGRQHAHLKRAFHQNASTYIVAYLRYRGRDGIARTVNAGFTRYSVLFTGERLPDGTTADAVSLVLSEPYLDLLNHAPVRPLDYAYLKALTPMAQRFYELLSYKMFAALKYRQPHATLRYTDYCVLSTQQRYTAAIQVQKQMYKVHRPHLDAGYLTQVHYDGTTDADGQPDWLLHYTPGPKARAEYAAFLRQPGAEVAAALVPPADADQEEEAATVIRAFPEATLAAATPVDHEATAPLAPRPQAPSSMPPPPTPEDGTIPPVDATQAQAHALVRAFYQRFHRLTQVTPAPKELAQAAQLLTQYGEAKAQYLVDFSARVAPDTHYQPHLFGGIVHYLPRALAAYEARATQATTQQTEATTRRWQERYMQWRQEAVARLRAALPAEDLAGLEAEHQARLMAAGTRAFALSLATRVAVDAALEARAGLPSFADWRQTQEVC